MKLIATINAEAKKANVSIDGAPAVICPIRKESSGHYTITLTGHVADWPRKYLSIGKELEDKVIEKDSGDYTEPRHSAGLATGIITGGNKLSARLKRVVTELAGCEDVTDEEAQAVAEVLNPIIARLETAEEDKKIDAQIAAIEAQLAALRAKKSSVPTDTAPAVDVDSTEYKEARVKARAKKTLEA